jgi:hypothetical protein
MMIQALMQAIMLMQAMTQVIGDDEIFRDMKYFFGVSGKLLRSLEEEKATMLMQVMM